MLFEFCPDFIELRQATDINTNRAGHSNDLFAKINRRRLRLRPRRFPFLVDDAFHERWIEQYRQRCQAFDRSPKPHRLFGERDKISPPRADGGSLAGTQMFAVDATPRASKRFQIARRLPDGAMPENRSRVATRWSS